MPECFPGPTKEQLSQRYEDLLSAIPPRLEDIHHLCSASPSTKLDHRHHAPSKRLRRLHKVSNELQSSKSSYMENLRWVCMVATQHKVLAAKGRLHLKLLHGLGESNKREHCAVQGWTATGVWRKAYSKVQLPFQVLLLPVSVREAQEEDCEISTYTTQKGRAMGLIETRAEAGNILFQAR